MQISGKTKVCHTIAHSTMQKKNKRVLAVYAQANLKCRLLNYTRNFPKGNAFAEKSPEISG